MKYFFSLLTMVCMCVAAVAAPGDNNSNRSRGERFRNGGGRRGGNFFERIKKQYPKEAAEIEKLRESNPEQARTKMRELMRKAGSEMNFRRNGGAREKSFEATAEQLAAIKAKYPAEFAAYEKLKTGDPEKAQAKLRELMVKTFGEGAVPEEKYLRDRNRRAVARTMFELQKRYPEEMKKIKNMQKTDPDGARKELRKLFSEAQLRMPEGARELNYEYIPPNLQQQYRNGMMNRNFPYGGGGFRMMGPGNWGGRR